ncbi:MAG: tetratricopeptide repeat protein [Candidatus Aminicenantales bacterium]
MNNRVDKTKTVELAEKLVKAGRFEEAIEEYKKLLAGEPADLSINNLIGDLYLQLGRTAEAIKAFQSVGGFYESKGYYQQALAIYKKINKLDPNHVIAIVKMGDLYASQGFVQEARREYLRAAELLRRENRNKELIFLFDKLVKLDRNNVSYKMTLAGLFQMTGYPEEALAQLNEATELLLDQGNIEEAQKIIGRAREIKPDDGRTLANYVEVLKRQGQTEEAIDIVQEVLKKDISNVRFRVLLGSLFLDKKELEEAEKIFSAVVEEEPRDSRARIKLGKIYVLQERPEKAYEIFEPLINSLLKKQKDDKAIGLIGIVLSAKKIYLPALEKLAAIFKARGDKTSQEVVQRLVLKEARARDLTETMFVALAELMELCPKDEALVEEYHALRKKLGYVDEKMEEEERLSRTGGEENIDFLLSKVDLYVALGLVRNARRILENLRLRFPHSAKVEEKIESLDRMKFEIREEEIPRRVEKVQEMETRIESEPEAARAFVSRLEEEAGEKPLTAADIFSDTEILPLPSEESKGRVFYDLTEKIKEELEMLETVYTRQLRGEISILEKDLSDIVRDFREEVRKKVGLKDFETRFHLGLAFLEQNLIDEAVEELVRASEDSSRALECYSIIGKAYRRKGDLEEAEKWLKECLKLVPEGSEEFFALQYELATLYEEKGNVDKALDLYRQISGWNAAYRDVSQKMKSLA